MDLKGMQGESMDFYVLTASSKNNNHTTAVYICILFLHVFGPTVRKFPYFITKYFLLSL
jgi:hypothetical protein